MKLFVFLLNFALHCKLKSNWHFFVLDEQVLFRSRVAFENKNYLFICFTKVVESQEMELYVKQTCNFP